ncbi:MAG TPA: ATP-binding protein [Thermoanaerobaculaceae bacterium]|nr:ATP-binding protein [Thermoanaerobaculaceae bacterium]
MTSVLPSRRFREAKLLIGVSLLMLVAMVAVEMGGVLSVAGLVEEEARAGAATAAKLMAGHLSPAESARYYAALRNEGWGAVLFSGDRPVWSIGDYGPQTPAWWPWRSREDWEKAGSPESGPHAWEGRQLVVAYQPLAGGRAIRVVQHARRASTAATWRTAGAVLALVVGMGGAVLAWALIARALAPYRELLAEAVRVTRGPGEEPEDRFLVATFRDAVRRLETSEADARQRADELEVLTQVLSREASVGVVITDTTNAVRAHNPVAQALIGGGLEVGRWLPEALWNDGRQALGEGVMEVRRFPLLASSGASLGHVVFISDRTSVEDLERALAEREQMAMLGELSAGMAHELRNALATIRGYLRLLPEADGPRRDRFVAAMEDEAGSLGALLDRFLSFAQPRELQRQSCEVSELLEEVAGRVRASFPSLDLRLDTLPRVVQADRMALAVILENLLRNAAEAVASQGRVTVRTVESGGRLRVVVEDDGPGGSPEVRERLFRPFASTKPSGGLGLAVSRRLARLHEGDITFEEPPGGGARFVLTLPTGGAL